MALKALGRGPGRPSWRLLERPTCSARKKARTTARANGSRFGVINSPQPAFSDMRSGCEPSASVLGLSLDGSDPSLSLGFRAMGLGSLEARLHLRNRSIRTVRGVLE